MNYRKWLDDALVAELQETATYTKEVKLFSRRISGLFREVHNLQRGDIGRFSHIDLVPSNNIYTIVGPVTLSATSDISECFMTTWAPNIFFAEAEEILNNS
jgi:hypothetical protein